MDTITELTPAEQQLILLKRQEEELERQKQEVQKTLRTEQATLKGVSKIRELLTADQAQKEAAYAFLKELGTGWMPQVTNTPSSHEEFEYETVTRPDGKQGSEKVILFHEDFTRSTTYLTNGNFIIKVKPHYKTEGKYCPKSVYQGYKMFLSGPGVDWKQENKPLKDAKTANKKVQEYIDSQSSARQLIIKREAAVSKTVNDLLGKYPGADVQTYIEWETPKWEKRGSEVDYVKLTLPNGITVKYKVYVDGSLSRRSLEFPRIEGDLVEILSKIEFPLKEA